MKGIRFSALLAGASFCVLAVQAQAQTQTQTQTVQAGNTASNEDTETSGQDIIVTARLSAERAIDVPATVTGLSSQNLQERNILSFEEIGSVVPSLNIAPGGIGSDAAVAFRGVQFDAGAQTSNTVTAYINDVPTNFYQLLNSLYDIGNIEILRGPQGTLRGQSAPSGAVGLITRRPDLDSVGGYASATLTDPTGVNVQGAIGVPLINDVLAVRLAGAYNRTSGNNIKSVNSTSDPFTEGKNFRATALFRPSDALEATLIYRHDESENQTYGSAVYGTGASAASFPALELVPALPGFLTIPAVNVPAGFNGPALDRRDDRAVQMFPDVLQMKTDSITAQLAWRFAGQRLFYVGDKTWTSIDQAPLGGDTYNLLPGSRSRGFFSQDFKYESHEIRLASEEPIGGFVDYTIGYYRARAKVTADYTSDGAFAFNGAFGSPLSANSPLTINRNYLVALDFAQRFRSGEDSFFANLNFHLGARTELSLGGRQSRQTISVASPSSTRDTFAAIPFAGPCVGTASGQTLLGPYTNAPLSASPYAGTCNVRLTAQNGIFAVTSFPLTELESKPFLWSASLSHKFTPDVMAYASVGTAWRIGPAVVGAPSCDTCGSNNFLKNEKSTGYEIGLKGKAFANRLTFSVALFQQDFTNFIAQSETLPYVGACDTATCTLSNSQFTYNAPMRARGFDIDLDFRASRDFQFGAALSYAKSQYRNASIPCADSDFDGTPDSGLPPTSVGGWVAAGGPASGPAYCITSGPTASIPPWNLIVRGEYSREAFADARAFLRWTFNYKPKNTNNRLVNPGFVPKAYALVDLFTGLTSSDGAWEVSVAAKNVFNTRTTLNEGINEGQFGQIPFSTYGLSSGYRTINRVPGRSFQISLRYAFGSR